MNRLHVWPRNSDLETNSVQRFKQMADRVFSTAKSFYKIFITEYKYNFFPLSLVNITLMKKKEERKFYNSNYHVQFEVG